MSPRAPGPAGAALARLAGGGSLLGLPAVVLWVRPDLAVLVVALLGAALLVVLGGLLVGVVLPGVWSHEPDRRRAAVTMLRELRTLVRG